MFEEWYNINTIEEINYALNNKQAKGIKAIEIKKKNRTNQIKKILKKIEAGKTQDLQKDYLNQYK